MIGRIILTLFNNFAMQRWSQLTTGFKSMLWQYKQYNGKTCIASQSKGGIQKSLCGEFLQSNSYISDKNPITI